MAGARVPGPLGDDTRSRAIDAGTLARARLPIPGPLAETVGYLHAGETKNPDIQASDLADTAAAAADPAAVADLHTSPLTGVDRAVTVNASFMDAHWASARGSKEGSSEVGGMMHVVPVRLLTHMKIYRFVMRGRPDDELYGGPWWVGVSAYEALKKLAALEGRSLRDVAPERLAILWEWTRRTSPEAEDQVNAVVHAAVRRPLSAWSGTPRTARSKVAGHYRYGEVRKPDRSITQLYVPGLEEKGPTGAPLWSDALLVLGVNDLE